jgi:hypothetical protein
MEDRGIKNHVRVVFTDNVHFFMRLFIVFTILGMGAAALLYAAFSQEVMAGVKNNDERSERRKEMKITVAKNEGHWTIPPIDARQPQQIQTATFALG